MRRRFSIIGWVIVGAMVTTLVVVRLVWGEIDGPATSTRSSELARLTQTHGNIRATLLGVSRGVTYRRTERGTPTDRFGPTPVQYLRLLFLVEKLGKPSGSNGPIGVIGPKHELDFHAGATVVSNIDQFERTLADMERLPELGSDAVSGVVYKRLLWAGPAVLPDCITVTARFFGEDFCFENIEMP